MASSAISIDTIKQSIGSFGSGPDGSEDGGGGDQSTSLILGNGVITVDPSNTTMGLNVAPIASRGNSTVIGSNIMPEMRELINSIIIGGQATIPAATLCYDNVIIGHGVNSGAEIEDSVIVGRGVKVSGNAVRNQIVIGNGATCPANNTAQIGNGNIQTLFVGNKGAVALQSDVESVRSLVDFLRNDLTPILGALRTIKDLLNGLDVDTSELVIPDPE